MLHYPAGTSCTTNHATTAYVDSAGTCFCDAANCQGGSPTCYDASNAICEPAPGSCTEVDTIEDLNYPIGLDIGLVACANDPDGDALTYSWGISNFSNDWNSSNSEISGPTSEGTIRVDTNNNYLEVGQITVKADIYDGEDTITAEATLNFCAGFFPRF